MKTESLAPWPSSSHGQPESPLVFPQPMHDQPPASLLSEQAASRLTLPEDLAENMPYSSQASGEHDHASPSTQWSSAAFDPRRLSTCRLDFADGLHWNDRKEKTIRSPYVYTASQPGKGFRVLAINAFNIWLEIPSEKLSVIASIVQMLHTASLLIDDVQDSSLLRRGRPVAYRIYGVAQTINSANYYYFLALKELSKPDNHDEAREIYQTEMLRLHQGQEIELYWRDTLTCPSEDEYLEMISNKTGGCFRLAIRLMQSQSSTGIDCTTLVQLLGLVFQIVDDYKNLADVDYTLLKGACEDLTESKFSFPIIHSLRSRPEDGYLVSILSQKPTDIDIKLAAVDYIKSVGSLDYTKAAVGALIGRARRAADEIDRGRGRTYGVHALLDKLALE